jgi:hypothetical protein
MADEKPKRRGPSTVAPEAEPNVRKGYEEAREPEPQGDGDPGPDRSVEPPRPGNAPGRPDAGAR